MHILNICLALLIFIRMHEALPGTISLALYENGPKTIGELQTNVKKYKTQLANYLLSFNSSGSKQSSAIPKFDANVRKKGNIELGGPSRTRLLVNFDTSFPGIWAISKSCYLSSICWTGKKIMYDSSASQFYEPDKINGEQRTVTISNGGAQLYGTLGFDTLLMGGDSQIDGAEILEVTSISSSPYGDSLADGVLGLGFPSSRVPVYPTLRAVLDRGLLSQPVFSLYLGNKTDSRLMLGGLNPTYYRKDTLQYHSIHDSGISGEWALSAKSISMSLTELCGVRCTVLVDTGTALLAIPSRSLKIMYGLLGISSNGDVPKIPCSGRKDMPDLKFIFDKQTITLTSDDYVIEMEKECVLGTMESPSDTWVLGELFLAKVYTVFDLQRMRIGFAKTTMQSVTTP